MGDIGALCERHPGSKCQRHPDSARNSFAIGVWAMARAPWGGGMIFNVLGSYDLAWRVGVLNGVTAGVVQIAFGGPAGPTRRMRRALVTG
jgi:hypothetical protein